MSFKKLGHDLHVWKSSFAPLAVDGKHRVPWTPGLRLTGIFPRSLKSDGVKEDSFWDGCAWVDSLENSSDRVVFSYGTLGRAVFRRPCDLVFAGVSRDYRGRIQPVSVSAPLDACWPMQQEGRPAMVLDVWQVESIARYGKLISMRSALVDASNPRFIVYVHRLTRAECESIGYRLVSRSLPAVEISPRNDGITLPFRYAEEAVGLRVLQVIGAAVDSFCAGEVVVEAPDIAATHTPWMAFVPKGTTLFTAHCRLRKAALKVPVALLRNGLITGAKCHLVHGTVAVYAECISPDLETPPIPCESFQQELYFLAKDDSDLVPLRTLREYDISSVQKRRLWRFGKAEPDAGAFYCLKSDLQNLPRIDRREAATALTRLKKDFPWAKMEHLSRSRDEMNDHDLYLNAASRGWRTFDSLSEKWEITLRDVASRFFDGDGDIFIKSPITGETLYMPPTYEKLASNSDALDAYLATVKEAIPLFTDIVVDPGTAARVMFQILSDV